MKRLRLWSWILPLLLAAAPPAAAQSLRLAQPNAARFPEVTVYAYPADARGVLLDRLDSRAFRLAEDGRPAQILSVDSDRGSLDVCLALDRSMSMTIDGKLDYAKAAAAEFVRQLAPEDQAALITFADGSTLDQGLTRDRASLLAAIGRARPSGATTTFKDAIYWSIAQVALQPHGGGSVVGAAPARPDARRVVVALTDGNDLSSRILPQEMLDYATANGVALCMVALGQDAAAAQMEDFARQTGGIYLFSPAPQDLQRLYVALAERLRHEYRVTFRTPRPAADGTRRLVKVEVPGAFLTGDTSYQAPGQGSLIIAVPASGAPGAGVAAGPVASGSGGGFSSPFALLLVAAGIAAAIAAFAVWLGTRRRDALPMADSNPRIDLLPLWVRQGHTRVGRAMECELVLDSQKVSRVHAVIEAGHGTFRVVDQGSSNGTYVNGRRVRGSRPIRVGDVVRFGDREFRFAGELG